MNQLQEMVQVSGPVQASKQQSSKATSSRHVDSQISQTLSNEKDHSVPQSSIKRRNSMENLKHPVEDRIGEEADVLEFSDYENVSAERSYSSDTGSKGKATTPVSKPTRAKLTKDVKREEGASSLTKDHRELQRNHSELINDLRVANREIRDQSVELRNVKKENVQLREVYTKLYTEMTEDPSKFSKRERSRYHEHFEMMQKHIMVLQHELEKRDTHIEMLTKQTREANQERDELDGGKRRLQRQIKELSTNLTECKDDLLRLQPTSQTSDSEIAERYSNLCQQIAGWVDDQTEDVETLEERFEGLSSTEDLNLDPTLALYTTQAHLTLAQEHPDSIPLLLQYLIHCYLGQYVLGNDIYFYGLDVHNVALIQQVEEGMKTLEPKRDAVTLRRWRSEALHGLLKVDEFVAARSEQGITLAKSLYSALAHMLGGADVTVSEEGWQELHKQVVLPAIELVTAIRASMVDYRFVCQLFNKSPEKAHTIFHNEIQHYQLVDNKTHKIIRPDSALKVADDGRIGTEILVVSPALLRKKDADHRTIISRPTVLVQLDQPMEKRSRGVKGFGSFVSSFLGGESNMEG